MSTVKAINFQHPSASAANITLASDGTVSGGIPSPNRNLLYNGAMQVSQRGTSTASITTGNYYTADRWNLVLGTLGTWTQSVENDAPTGSGFRKSLKMLCTTADASPAAGDICYVTQTLEGQDLQRIAKGTSSAQQLTLSFWVKANVTGTYICELYDNDNTRAVSASYTISASATWEKKTITLPADTTGAFDNDNALSVYVIWHLGAGSNFTSGSPLQTTWGAYTAANRATGQTNLAAATNNYWQVTGVQLEVGSQATAFEFKSYQQDLRECQRYYQRFVSGTTYGRFGIGSVDTTTTAQCYMSTLVPMRVTATAIDTTGTASNYAVYDAGVVRGCTAVPFILANSTNQTNIVTATTTTLTAGRAVELCANNNSTVYIGLSAEL